MLFPWVLVKSDTQITSFRVWTWQVKFNPFKLLCHKCSNITDYFSTHKITTPWRRNTHTHSPIQNKDALTKARTSYLVLNLLKPTNILTPTTTMYYNEYDLPIAKKRRKVLGITHLFPYNELAHLPYIAVATNTRAD